MDERLREKIADIIVEREDESPLDRADAILQIPEIAAALARKVMCDCGKAEATVILCDDCDHLAHMDD